MRLLRMVDVRVEAGWLPAELYAVRRTPAGRWEGYVEYTVGMGRKLVDWRDQAELSRPGAVPRADPEGDARVEAIRVDVARLARGEG